MALARCSLSAISNRGFACVRDQHAEIHSIVPENSVTILPHVVSNERREPKAYRIQKFNPDDLWILFSLPVSSPPAKRASLCYWNSLESNSWKNKMRQMRS